MFAFRCSDMWRPNSIRNRAQHLKNPEVQIINEKNNKYSWR